MQAGSTNARIDALGEKIDALSQSIDKRIEQADDKLDAVRKEMKEGFNRVDDKLDTRVDELRRETKEGFDRHDVKLDGIDAKFDRVHDRLDSMQRTMLHGVLVLVGVLVAGLSALIVLIATQL